MGNMQKHYTIQTLTQAILIPQFFPVFEKSSGHASCPKFGIMQASKFLEWGQRHPSKTFWHQRRVTVGSNTSNRVDYNNFPAHLPRIAHGRRRSAALFSVIDGQQSGGVVYQKAVAVQHTIFVVGPADVNDGIRPLQDRMIEVPR